MQEDIIKTNKIEGLKQQNLLSKTSEFDIMYHSLQHFKMFEIHI